MDIGEYQLHQLGQQHRSLLHACWSGPGPVAAQAIPAALRGRLLPGAVRDAHELLCSARDAACAEEGQAARARWAPVGSALQPMAILTTVVLPMPHIAQASQRCTGCGEQGMWRWQQWGGSLGRGAASTSRWRTACGGRRRAASWTTRTRAAPTATTASVRCAALLPARQPPPHAVSAVHHPGIWLSTLLGLVST